MSATSQAAAVPLEAPPWRETADTGVRRIATAAELDELAPVWNDLLDRCSWPYVLLDHRWVSAWWRAFGAGKELHVLVIERGERPVGIVPMIRSHGLEAWPIRDGRLQIAEDHRNVRLPRWRRVVPVRRVTFPLNMPSYNTRSHAIVAEDEAYVCTAAVDYWSARRSDWDVIALEGIPSASGQRSAFQAAAARHGLPSPAHGTVRTFYMADLTGGFEGYLARHSSHFRKRRKEQIRTCQKAGRLEMDIYRGSDIARGLDLMFDIERDTWKARPDPGAKVRLAVDEPIRGFVTDAAIAFARADDAVIHVMSLDGRPVGAMMGLSRRCTMLTLFIHLRDDVRDRLNAAPLWTSLLEDAAAHGMTEIDIHGLTENVRKWATHGRDYQRLYIFNRSLRGLLLWGSKTLATTLARRLAKRRDESQGDGHEQT